MTKEQVAEHNRQVLKIVLGGLIESDMVDIVKLLTDEKYACEMISTYIEATNLVRETLNMQPMVFYEIKD